MMSRIENITTCSNGNEHMTEWCKGHEFMTKLGKHAFFFSILAMPPTPVELGKNAS